MTILDTTPAPLLLTIGAVIWTAIGVYIWAWFNSFDDNGSN